MKLKYTLLLINLLLTACNPGNGDTPDSGIAHFAFTDVNPKQTFVIELRNPELIAHARKVLNGEETSRVHVMGTIVKKPADYNPGWSYHLQPASIDFFEFSIEVCDAAMQYVEDHLDEVGGAFLPNNHWCPWRSRLVKEL